MTRSWWYARFRHSDYGTRRSVIAPARDRATALRRARSWLDREFDCDRFTLVQLARGPRVTGSTRGHWYGLPRTRERERGKTATMGRMSP